MKLPLLPRWVAPVLVVAMLLLTAWASYNLVQVAAARSNSGGSAVAFTGAGSYGYNATLAPNTLFNGTKVSGSNVTLFVSITEWINVTVVTSVSAAAPANIGLSDRFDVTLSTPAWSKVLSNASHLVSAPNVPKESVTDRYAINVSALEATVARIDTQLNYTTSVFTVRLASAVSAGVGEGSSVTLLPLLTALNLTFRGPVITPSGPTAKSSGSVASAADPPPAASIWPAELELGAAVAALGVAVWLLWAVRIPDGGIPDLDQLIEPYTEVIARTTRPPDGVREMPVDTWEDLVKVADTLGRPILRPAGGPADPEGSDFYVFDGTVAYLYRHPGGVGDPAPVDAFVPEAPGPRPPVPPAAGTSAPPTSAPPSAPGLPPAAPPVKGRGSGAAVMRRAALQLRAEMNRIRDAPLEPGQQWYLYSLFTHATRKIAVGSPEEARWAAEEFRRAVDMVLDDLRHNSA